MKFCKKNFGLFFVFCLFSGFVLFAQENDEETPVVEEPVYLEHLEPSKVELTETTFQSVIEISANVSKADVYINNVFQGRTKLLITDLMPGEYILEVVKGDKKSLKWLITVKRGYKNIYFVELN